MCLVAEPRSRRSRVRVLIDECCDRMVALGLSEAGWDVAYVAHQYAGAEDRVLVDVAATEDRIIITQDYDFGDLVIRQAQASCGVALIACPGLARADRVRRAVTALVSEAERLAGALTIIEPDRIRRRALPKR